MHSSSEMNVNDMLMMLNFCIHVYSEAYGRLTDMAVHTS